MSATAASAAITAIQNPAAVSIIDRGGAVCGSSSYGVPRIRSNDHWTPPFEVASRATHTPEEGSNGNQSRRTPLQAITAGSKMGCSAILFPGE